MIVENANNSIDEFYNFNQSDGIIGVVKEVTDSISKFDNKTVLLQTPKGVIAVHERGTARGKFQNIAIDEVILLWRKGEIDFKNGRTGDEILIFRLVPETESDKKTINELYAKTYLSELPSFLMNDQEKSNNESKKHEPSSKADLPF